MGSNLKVLALNPPSPKDYIRTGRWTRKSRASQDWYPIWLSYMVALLEREEHKCLLLDAGTEGMDYIQCLKPIYEFKPDLIAYYYGFDTLKDDLEYADILAKNFEVVLVGPWGHCVPNLLDLVKNIDVATFGEFDYTVLDIANGIPYEKVLGIKHRNNGEITAKPRPLCTSKELDEIPFVTSVYKRHLNLKLYRQTSIRYPFVDLFGARSCPYDCTFCLWVNAFHDLQPGRYRTRSIDNIIEELWYVKNEIPEAKQIWFQDDTILPPRARELSQRIIDEDLNICWGGYSRAEQDYETLKLMKESGLRTLHIGYETSDPEVLQEIKKCVTVEQMNEFARYIRDLNLWTCAGFMIFPWQSKESVRNTIQWAKHEIRPRRFSFTQLFPYPNTPICKTIDEYENANHPMLSKEEMVKLEKEGFTEIYLKNLPWLFDTLKFPREWGNVLVDAWSLLKFLWE